MKRCDTCGGPLADGHPFALCPKCLFGGAIHSHDAGGEAAAGGKFRLSPRHDFFEKYDILEKVAGGGQGGVWKTGDFYFHRCGGEKVRLAPRDMIFEKNIILEKIAGGGQSEVWKTWDFEFHRCVAMKRIAEHAAGDLPAVHRFLAEAQIASQLDRKSTRL